jgi:hypothetical protein
MKQKTNKPKSTCSKLARRNGNAGNDNKPLMKYEAELFWTQHNCATVIIEARSLQEAERKADELSSEDIDDWNPVDGELFVNSVELASGGSDGA